MPRTTRYVVQVTSNASPLYFTGLNLHGKPYAWTREKKQAPTYATRLDAIAAAQRLGVYLADYSAAGASDARTIKIRPSTGGLPINWRFTDFPQFAVGQQINFTFPYSATRSGEIVSRCWSGQWCYTVWQAGIFGEWNISESIISA